MRKLLRILVLSRCKHMWQIVKMCLLSLITLDLLPRNHSKCFQVSAVVTVVVEAVAAALVVVDLTAEAAPPGAALSSVNCATN